MGIKIHMPMFEQFQKHINEDYPASAEHDPNAPWNVKETKPLKNVTVRKYVYVAGNGEVLILSDGNDMYTFYHEHMEPEQVKSIAINYIGVQSESHGRDEEGDTTIEYDTDNYKVSRDLPHEALVDYVNDNINNLSVGAGYADWEIGEKDLVKIDPDIEADIKNTYSDLNF